MHRTQILKRQPIADRVKDLILERILDGSYPPGFRLVEAQIAREFEISLAPLREALQGLEAAGLVQSEPYRGTRVRQIAESEILEALQVRGVLEEFSATLAAPSLKGRSQGLRTQNAAMVTAGKTGDHKRSARMHFAFHRAIVEAAGNSVLLRVWDSLALQAGFPLRVWQLRFDYHRMANEHAPIIDALERGGGALAGRLLRAHCTGFAKVTPRARDRNASVKAAAKAARLLDR